MHDCYYTCNLLPLDLVARAGYSPRWLGNHLRDPGAPARRDALSVHPMTCPYVTKLVAAAEDALTRHTGAAKSEEAGTSDCLVVPGGCDAARRMGDLLNAAYPDQVFMLHVPRPSTDDAVERLASDLERLDRWLRSRLPDGAALGAESRTDKGVVSSLEIEREPPAVDYPQEPRPGGVFVVSGPLSDDSLLSLIDKLGAHVSGLESCTSPDRWKPLAPDAGGGIPDGAGDGRPLYEAAAKQILEVGMCPRRSTVDRRAHLERRLDQAKPSSIIYARQSFCDPGAYDALLVARLARERRLPFLEIEVDFPFDANGPLRVRVEAFLEAQLMDDDLLGDDLLGDDLFEEL